MPMSNRKFGVEIEAFGISKQRAMDVIVAAGVPCTVEGYTHTVMSHWKIVSDSSVHGGDGFEAVSPILEGEEGLSQIKKVCAALTEAGARPDKTCGFHVHVNAKDLTVNDMKNIITRYANFEDIIDTFMPLSRRGNNNTYCKSVKQWLSNNTRYFNRSYETCREFANIMSDRTHKINLNAYIRHKTIEFRHHSGTTNAEKVCNWVKFCLNFVEMSRVQMVNRESSLSSNGSMRAASVAKFSRIIDLLKSNGSYGVSVERIADATGFQQNTVKAMLSKIKTEFGFNLQRQRRWIEGVGHVSHYHIDETTPVVSPVVVENDTVYRGLDNTVISYYNERIMEHESRNQ